MDVLTRFREAHLYQNYLRPILWAPIRVHRVYRDVQKGRFYRTLAAQDRQQLSQARSEHEARYTAQLHPLVSITTPTYNRARLLVERTLPSVLAQTYGNIEWIIVGDHCTDETAERLAEINDPRVRFYNLPTRPRYPRRKEQRWRVVGTQANNLAHSMARGSWIAYLDDDDVFTPDHIAKLLSHAQAGNYEFVAGASRLELMTGQWIVKGREKLANGWPQFSHSAVLYRSYLATCFPYDDRCLRVDVGGDGFRWQRMLNAGVRAGFLQDIVAHLPLRPGEASRSICQPD